MTDSRYQYIVVVAGRMPFWALRKSGLLINSVFEFVFLLETTRYNQNPNFEPEERSQRDLEAATDSDMSARILWMGKWMAS